MDAGAAAEIRACHARLAELLQLGVDDDGADGTSGSAASPHDRSKHAPWGTLRFPRAQELTALSQAQLDAFFDGAVGRVERLVSAIQRVISADEEPQASALLKRVVADRQRYRHLPIAQCYVEDTLWRTVRGYSERSVREVESLVAAARAGDGGGKAAGRREVSLRFREFYLNELIGRYGEELSALQGDAAGMGGAQVDVLVRCLESGVDIFSDVDKHILLDTVDTAKQHNERQEADDVSEEGELHFGASDSDDDDSQSGDSASSSSLPPEDDGDDADAELAV